MLCPSSVLDVGFAGDAHVGNICFPVGAQGWNINKQVPGVGPGSRVRRDADFPLGGRYGVGNAAGYPSTGFFRLAHYWVLRQQGRAPAPLVLVFPAEGRSGRDGVRGVVVVSEVFLRRSKAFTVNTWAAAGCDGVVV